MNTAQDYPRLKASVLACLTAGLGAAPLILGSGAALAQDQQAENQTEEVVVTGTRIRRDEFSSSAPIQVITAEVASLEGLIDVGDILQQASVAQGSVQFNNRFGGFVIEGGTGVRPISLRGLGAQRSLVLLNGRRSGPAGVRGQVSGFDLNVIPDSIVQRFEILKDGASSIYGSDAVAGVVNIITRTQLDGPEFTFDMTKPSASGGEARSISAAHGFNFDKGSVVIAGEVQQRDPIRLRDRDFLSCQEDLVTTGFGQPLDREDRGINTGTEYAGCFNLYANTAINLFSGDRYIQRPDGQTVLGDYLLFDLDLTPGSAYAITLQDRAPSTGYAPRTNARYNSDGSGQAYYEDQLFFPQANSEMVQNQTERSSLYISSTMDFDAGGGITWNTEALANNRKTISEGWRQFFPLVGGAILLDFYDLETGDYFPEAIPWGAYSYANDPSWNNSMNTLALPVIPYPSNSSVSVDYYSVASSVQGDFGQSSWNWSVDFTTSQSEGVYGNNAIVASRSGDLEYDDNPPQFDYFAPNFLKGNYPQSFIDTIGQDIEGSTVYEQTVLTGVFSGDIFELPGGTAAMAVGVEYRDFSIDDQPDQLSIDGDLWGQSSALVTKGEDSVSEIFAEFDLPFIAGKRGIEELSLNVSARAFDYDTSGSDSVWKAGLNWQIIPALRLRATRGTSYRAPALYELYLGNQTSFAGQLSLDPCIAWGESNNPNIRANCAADGIPEDFTGGSVSATIITGGGAGVLNSETSEAETFGFILTPGAGNFSVAMDYFKIDVFDQIGQLGAGAILGGCYGSPQFPNNFCSLFTRRGLTGDQTTQLSIETVTDSYINVNRQTAEGWDLTLRMQRDFSAGSLLVETQGTYTLQDVQNLFDPGVAAGFETDEFNKTIGQPKWTSNTRISFQRNDWTFSWFINHISGMDNTKYFGPSVQSYFGYPNAVYAAGTGSVNYHDFSVRWEGPRISVIGGINNFTDRDPPFVSDGVTSRVGNIPIFASQYDLMGRAAFLSMSASFQ